MAAPPQAQEGTKSSSLVTATFMDQEVQGTGGCSEHSPALPLFLHNPRPDECNGFNLIPMGATPTQVTSAEAESAEQPLSLRGASLCKH